MGPDPGRRALRTASQVAILLVLCKPLWIEGYRIPSPSMQPTLMGPDAALLRDVVLVDKLRFAVAEPRRWELAAFRFPLLQTSLHVKRIVGLPGDRLRIAGGNLWQVDDGKPRRVHRKPPALQERSWREIYPMRRCLQPQAQPLDEYFEAGGGAWRTDGDDLVVTLSAAGPATLAFTNPTQGGLADRLFDGYPASEARLLYERAGRGVPFEGVADARWSFSVTATALASLRITLTIRQTGRPVLALRSTLTTTGGVLSVVEADDELLRHGFACRMPAATPTVVSFTHVDGILIARCGDSGAELDASTFERLAPLRPHDLSLELELEGVGDVRLATPRVERDVHYLAEGLVGNDRTELVVPAEHYFVLGDNPRESTDSRSWRGVELGWRGALTPPAVQGARPGHEENPLCIDDQRMLFTDVHGNVHVVQGELKWGDHGDGPRPSVRRAGAPATQQPPFTTHFVPRAALVGRPFVAGIVHWRWLH